MGGNGHITLSGSRQFVVDDVRLGIASTRRKDGVLLARIMSGVAGQRGSSTWYREGERFTVGDQRFEVVRIHPPEDGEKRVTIRLVTQPPV